VFPYYGFWGNLKEEKLMLTAEQGAPPDRSARWQTSVPLACLLQTGAPWRQVSLDVSPLN